MSFPPHFVKATKTIVGLTNIQLHDAVFEVDWTEFIQIGIGHSARTP